MHLYSWRLHSPFWSPNVTSTTCLMRASRLIIQQLEAEKCCRCCFSSSLRSGFIEKLFTRVHFRSSDPEMEYYSLFLCVSHNKVSAILLMMTHVWIFSRRRFPHYVTIKGHFLWRISSKSNEKQDIEFVLLFSLFEFYGKIYFLEIY